MPCTKQCLWSRAKQQHRPEQNSHRESTWQALADGWAPVPNKILHRGLSFPHGARHTCIFAPVPLHFNCFYLFLLFTLSHWLKSLLASPNDHHQIFVSPCLQYVRKVCNCLFCCVVFSFSFPAHSRLI